MTTCYDCSNSAYYCDYCYFEEEWYYGEFVDYSRSEYINQPEEVALADIFIMEGSVWEPAFPIESNA